MPPFLQARNLRKQFDSQVVLEDIAFSLEQGECLVLLGPSGCGKTTLLNIIAGLLAADDGELVCDGELIDSPRQGIRQPMQSRRFSMVFQDFALWPHMTVAENVGFGLKVQGVKAAERRRRVTEVLEQVRMDAFAGRSPGNLSGGQQQRVAIARALAVRPRLLLMDEPLSALDARLREDLKNELAGLLHASGVTVIYVTHDQSEAFTLASRIALMHQGRINQIGAPEAIYAEPETAFAAGFLGVSNLLPYRRDSESIVLGRDTTLSLPVNGSAADSGHLMVRREAVTIHRNRLPANGHVMLPGICQQRNFLGDRHEVFVAIDGELTLRGFADAGIHVGAEVQVCFPPEAVRFLPH